MHMLRKCTIISVLMASVLATSAYAGGSLFGHKAKTVNTNGVHSIGVHICGSLECPPVRIFEGKCNQEHMSMHWGVCVCDKGYVPKNGKCDACPEGQYSDGIHNCQSCPEGKYIAHDGDTKCSDCPDGAYCTNGQKYDCPMYSTCSTTGFECNEGFTTSPTSCICPSGKYIDGDECKTCPEHASCDGEKYTCTNGYDKTDAGCECAGSKFEEDGKCFENKCVGITLNQCQESCDPKTGQITNKTTRTPCNYEGTNDGECYVGHCNPQGCPVSTESSYYTSSSPEDCAKCFGATYYNETGYCFACPQLGQNLSWPDSSSCSACDDASWAVGRCTICASDQVLRLDNGSCVSCPAEGSSVYPVNESDCLNKCSGASWTNYSCHRCAGNQMISLDGSSCVACPQGGYVYGTTESSCHQCENAYYASGYCFACDYTDTGHRPQIPLSECDRCSTFGFEIRDGVCATSCGEGQIFNIANQSCDSCPSSNRDIALPTPESDCYSECSNVYHYDGICTSCEVFTNYSFAVLKSNQGAISACEHCPNTDLINGHCYRSDTPLIRTGKGEYGQDMYSCDEPSIIDLHNLLSHNIAQKECAKCPNRDFWDTEGKCALKCDDGKVRTGNNECIDIPHGWTTSLGPTSCSMAGGIYAYGCIICDDGEQGAVKNNTPGCYPCSDTGPFDYVFSTKWCH